MRARSHKPAKVTPALRLKLTVAERRMAQAEFIGWPALAESFRRELEALRAQVSAGVA